MKKPSRTSRKTASRRAYTSSKRRVTKPKLSASKKGNPSRARKTNTKLPSLPPIVSSLSLDRKLDMVGVILTLLGLLTLVFLLSTNRSTITEIWVSFLSFALGWGVFILPLGLIGIGLWLILRNFDRLPQLAIERILGILLLHVNLLTLLHFLNFPVDKESSYALAAAGKGGGYLGSLISDALVNALGLWGTTTTLLAWMLIGLILTMDVTIAALFRWAPSFFTLLKKWLAHQTRHTTAIQQSVQPHTQLPITSETNPGLGGPTLSDVGTSTMLDINTSTMPVTSLRSVQALSNAEGIRTGPQEWVLPLISEMLDEGSEIAYSDEYDLQRAQVIEETLTSFNAPAHVVEINRGPTITQFGVEPDFIETRTGRTRVRVNKISSLADDLALALAASRIRIQAPVPGKGYVGIEVPNNQIALVSLRDVIEGAAFRRLRSPLRFALGQDVAGNAVAANLAAMPHLLVAGATGSGKSVCINAIISCFLLHNTPDDLRLIMVDPKRVELNNYNGIPHLLAPVVVELERITGALLWITREMDSRYQKFADIGARNIADYNKKMEARGEKLPHLVIIIDELADLMMLAPDQTEKAITRLAQLARATGIHLIIATQRPSVDVVTGLIKANFPARIAFAVSSGIDSRVILDQPGAERLLGRGDMLFQAPDAPAPVRLQGVFVSDPEILRLVQYWRGLTPQATTTTGVVSDTLRPTSAPADAPPPRIPLNQTPVWTSMVEDLEPVEETDPLFNEAVDLIRRRGRASVSMLQRRLRVGYTRAARLVETMEEKGIVGPPEGGAQTRSVLDYGPAAPPAGNE